MKAISLYLVRHGSIGEATEKRFLGHTEAPLSSRGVQQAEALRDWLQSREFTRVLCSDLIRSHRTAKIIMGSRRPPIEVYPELQEISLGEWDGVSFREIRAKYPEEFKARGADIENWRPPGGESFADCRRRVLGFLNRELAESEGNILVVAHAGVNRLILCDALGLPIANLWHIGQNYGCVNIVEFGPELALVHLLNFVPPSSAKPGESKGTRRRGASAR